MDPVQFFFHKNSIFSFLNIVYQKWPRVRNFVRFFGVILIRLYFEMGPFEQKLDYVWQLLKTCVKDAKKWLMKNQIHFLYHKTR